jgi:hypothetical protein
VRLGLDLASVLLGRQHLLEQRLQLHLAEHAARLDVGQHPLQVAHALRQRLHLAQALVHLLQPLGHLPEALAQPGLQRGLQLLVDRLAHLVELGGVGLLQDGQLRLERGADLGDAARVLLREVLQLVRERVGQRLLQQRELLRERVDLRVLRARGFAPCLTTASWNVASVCVISCRAPREDSAISRRNSRSTRSLAASIPHGPVSPARACAAAAR